MKTISILIATYNGWQRVNNLLESIKQRTDPSINYEVVVCDDSGKQEHRNYTKMVCDNYGAKFIYHEHNRGVPSTWNTLVRSTDSPYLMLLNDDIIVGKNWLTHPLYAVSNNPKVSAFGLHCYFITLQDTGILIESPTTEVIPLYVRYEGGQLIRNERFPSMPVETCDPPGRVMCPVGCAFTFSRVNYELIGGFDERYQAFYEETDAGCSWAFLGLPAMQLTYPANYHVWSQTFATAPEINAGKILNESRQKFVSKWTQKLNVKFNDAPDIHNLLMDKIPSIEVKWLDKDMIERTSLA